MIKFTRIENKVVIYIEHGIFHNNHVFSMDILQSFDYQAELLRQAFQDNLNKHLSEIKREYYNQGWKNAKAKDKKRTEFWGGWK